MIDVKWPYPMTQISADRSVPRVAVRGMASELVGVDGRLRGGLQPFPGFEKAYELDFFDDPNHDATSEVTDSIPVNFRRSNRSYAYGFVYRARRRRTGGLEGTADVFVDFYDVTAQEWVTGTLVGEAVDPDAQMDVAVFGRLCYVFVEGRSPILFYVQPPPEVGDATSGSLPSSSSDERARLVVLGRDGTPPLPGPGLKTELISPEAAGALGSIVTTEDSLRPGRGQVVLTDVGPKELGLFEALEEENPFVGGGVDTGGLVGTCPRVIWKQGEFSGKQNMPEIPVQSGDVVFVFLHRSGADADQSDLEGMTAEINGQPTTLEGTDTKASGTFGDDDVSVISWHSWESTTTGLVSAEITWSADPVPRRLDWHVFVVRGADTAGPVADVSTRSGLSSTGTIRVDTEVVGSSTESTSLFLVGVAADEPDPYPIQDRDVVIPDDWVSLTGNSTEQYHFDVSEVAGYERTNTGLAGPLTWNLPTDPSKVRWYQSMSLRLVCGEEESSSSSSPSSESSSEGVGAAPDLVTDLSVLSEDSAQASGVLTGLAVGQFLVAYGAIKADTFADRDMRVVVGSEEMLPIESGGTPFRNDDDIFGMRMQAFYLQVTPDNIDSLTLDGSTAIASITGQSGGVREMFALFVGSYAGVDQQDPFAAPFQTQRFDEQTDVTYQYSNSSDDNATLVTAGITLSGGTTYFPFTENARLFQRVNSDTNPDYYFIGDTTSMDPASATSTGYTLSETLEARASGLAGVGEVEAPSFVSNGIGVWNLSDNSASVEGLRAKEGDYVVAVLHYTRPTGTFGAEFENTGLVEVKAADTGATGWSAVGADFFDIVDLGNDGSPGGIPWDPVNTDAMMDLQNAQTTFNVGFPVTREMLEASGSSSSSSEELESFSFAVRYHKPTGGKFDKEQAALMVFVLRGVVTEGSFASPAVGSILIGQNNRTVGNGYGGLDSNGNGQLISSPATITLPADSLGNDILVGGREMVFGYLQVPDNENFSITGRDRVTEEVVSPVKTSATPTGGWGEVRPRPNYYVSHGVFRGVDGVQRLTVSDPDTVGDGVQDNEIVGWTSYTVIRLAGVPTDVPPPGGGGGPSDPPSSSSSSSPSSSPSSSSSQESSSSSSSSASSSSSSASSSTSSSSSSSSSSTSETSSTSSSSASSSSSTSSSSSSSPQPLEGFPDSLLLSMSLRAAGPGDCEDFKDNFVVELLSPPNGRENVGVGAQLVWNGFYTDGRPDPSDLVYDVFFQVVGETNLILVATTSEESFDPGTLFANGDLPFGGTFRWSVRARRTSLPDDCFVEAPTWEFSTLEEFEARKIEPGDYVFGYVLYDSRTGRQSAFSEIAQCRSEDFPLNQGDDADRRIEQYAAIEILYDSDKYDQAWIYRSVKVQDAGGTLIASWQHLDAIIDLETYHTINNGEGALPESEPWRQAIYYYRLEDKQLVWQEVYTDLPSYDAEMPRGGTAVMFNNTMLVGKVTGGDASTPEENRQADAFTGLGELRWSSIPQLSPELFPPQNRYTPSVPSNEVIKLEKVAGNVLGFSKDRMYHIRREGQLLQIREMHEGFLGAVNHKATAVAGSTVYVVTSKGVKSVDGFAKLESLRAMDRIFKEDWVRDLTSVSCAYDPRASVLFFLNPDREAVTCLWFETAMSTELLDAPFSEVRQGAWPIDPDDFDSDLTERALFLMNSPDLDTEVSGWKPRIYVMNYERDALVSGTDSAQYDGNRRVSLLLPSGDLRFATAAAAINSTNLILQGDAGVVDPSVVGSYVYCISGEEYGTKARIVAVADGALPDTRELTLDRPVSIAQGARVHIDAIYTRIVGSPVGSNNPQGGLAEDYYRLKKVDTLKPSFVDVDTYEGDTPSDITFRGLIYDGSGAAPTSAEFPTNEAGVKVRGVTELETQYPASFGKSSRYLRRAGVQGASLSPGVEIICSDLDYRLLGMLVGGSVQDTTIGEAPRANPS